MEKSNFNAIVGEKMFVSLDTQYLPSRGITFISDKAKIVREGDRLTITPNEAGMFRVKMMNCKEQVDYFVLYAKEAEAAAEAGTSAQASSKPPGSPIYSSYGEESGG